MSVSVAAPRPKRKSPTRIDWKGIARQLAEGARPTTVAAAAGIEEDRLWRHLRASLRFRFYLAQALERQRLLAGLQLGAAGRSAALSRSLNPESLDSDLLRCLLAESQPDGIAQQVEQLGATGQRPPNMAFRRRIAAERRQMDAQVAAIRAECAAEAAGSMEKSDETPRSTTNAGEHQRSATNAGEAQRSTANTGEASASPNAPGAVSARPARPSSSRVTHTPAIVDLDGPDLARLRASGALSPGPSGD